MKKVIGNNNIKTFIPVSYTGKVTKIGACSIDIKIQKAVSINIVI